MVRAARSIVSKDHAEALAIGRIAQELHLRDRSGRRVQLDDGKVGGVFDWLYECGDGSWIGVEVVRALDQATEQDIWGKAKIGGSTAVAPDKLGEAIRKKAENIDRYRDVLALACDGRNAEMHLAVVDPWDGELFIPAFLEAMRETAAASPFEEVWFVDLRHGAYLASEPAEAVREIDTDVAGLPRGEGAFISTAYLRTTGGGTVWVLCAAEASSHQGPGEVGIWRDNDGALWVSSDLTDIARSSPVAKGECEVGLMPLPNNDPAESD